MKKLFVLLVAISATIGALAQNAANRMTVVMKGGASTTFKISDIDSIRFYYEGPAVSAEGAVVVAFPNIDAFGKSSVLKVMSGDKQLGELAWEYIRPQDKRMIVAYGMGKDGKADLSRGYTSDGGTIEWNLSENTCTYTAGGTAVTQVWFDVNGNIKSESIAGASVATLSPDVIVDKRGGEEKIYPVVKIGTQYWMAKSLATAYYTDGTALELCNTDQQKNWKANTTGAYHMASDNAEDITDYFGYMYNGYAVMSNKLAPEGWKVPSFDQWKKLKAYVGSASAKYKSDDAFWTVNVGTNVTGFSALPGGYFSVAVGVDGDRGIGAEVSFWSNSSKYDALSKADTIPYVRLTGKGKNFVVSDFSPHDYLFGHYVRCIRK